MYTDLYFSNRDTEGKASKFRLFSRHPNKWLDFDTSTHAPGSARLGKQGDLLPRANGRGLLALKIRPLIHV